MELRHEPTQNMFDSLNQHLEELTTRLQGSKNAIKVLEIGVGTGETFKHYRSPIQLSTIDLNPLLNDIAQKLSVEYPLIHIVDNRVGNAENMTCFGDNSFDIVCVTFAMCCIKDNVAALAEIHRVLKPNGRYYYMEGNRMRPDQSFLNRFLEAVLAKFWSFYGHGCKAINNNFDEKLKASKLVMDWHQIYLVPESFFGQVLHYGYAQKM